MAVWPSTKAFSLAFVLLTQFVMPPLYVADQEKRPTYGHSQQSDSALDARLTNAEVLQLVRAGLGATGRWVLVERPCYSIQLSVSLPVVLFLL